MRSNRTQAAAPVWCRREGRLGRITLNRPAALNALNLPMIRAITAALQRWQVDRAVEMVVLDGAGERGLCAGGDLRLLHESALHDRGLARRLWQEEYRLDARMARYPRPVVALMDGLVMGGGVGLSAHADVRVVTERSVLSMPEVAIGLSPDVGASYLLARSPGEVGTHLALTGARIGPRDAVFCGLADHIVASEGLGTLLEALQGSGPQGVTRCLAMPALRAETSESALPRARSWIDACYAADTVEDILAALRSRPEPGAREAYDAMRGAAPTALKVALRALRRATGVTDLESCLVQDFRTSLRFLTEPDLVEGIRAAVIDKDRKPRWSPAHLADVTPAAVARHFRRPPGGDLSFSAARPGDSVRSCVERQG